MNRLLLTLCAVVVLGCTGSASGGAGGGTGGGVGGGSGGGGAPLKCGNGTLETDEACEGFELRARTCLSEGFDRGQLRCSSACTLDVSGCSRCGDGKITGAERCDLTLFAGKTCATEVDAGATGELQCLSACEMISTSACTFPPQRNQPCNFSQGCAAPFVCDLVPPTFTSRCRLHCEASAIGTVGGCPATEQCLDGGLELEGARSSPPMYVDCGGSPAACGAGYSCQDAGFLSRCLKQVGLCQ